MDDVQKTGEIPAPTAEELKQEDEVLQETPQDQVRASIIEKYGLDEEANAALIDQLTSDTLEQRKVLGKAIKQKRTYRDAAKAPKPAEVKPSPAAPPQPQPSPDLDSLVNERFEQRDLEALDYPDELKPQIKQIAKLNGISVRKAAQDPYIQFRKQELEQQQRADDAAISRTSKTTTVKFDPNNPPKVDMSTAEGQKTWENYTKFLASQEPKG